jgi:hypothetical protein
VAANVLARCGAGFLIVVACSAAVADAIPLTGARLVERSGDSIVVEFLFDEDVRPTARDVGADAFEIRLRTSSLASGWNQRSENYSGELGAISQIEFEGSGAGGYRLAAQLNAPMNVEVLPQPDSRRIAVRLTPAAANASAAPPQIAVESTAAEPPPAVASASEPGDSATSPDQSSPFAAPATSPEAGGAAAADADSYRQALRDGRRAAMAQEYPRAIALFAQASLSTEVAVRQEALEMLGMARERNHQDTAAKIVYEQFLEQYPDSPASARIQQRLAGLITRSLPVQQKLKVAANDSSAWATVGNIGQFYQRVETQVNGENPVVAVNGLFTSADVITSHRSDSLDLTMRISTNGLYDFTSNNDSTYQTTTAYFDAQQKDWGVDVRVGRQSQQSNGVLGRYDGAQVQYNVNSWLRVGALGGYAVDYSQNAFSSDRPVYGVNARVVALGGALEFAPFFIEQQANGVLDRRAVGMETRYFNDNVSAFSLLDYDTYHQALNTTYTMLNWRFDGGLTTYATFDRRRSPYLTTENALIGQGVSNLGGLENTYDSQQIQQLADDRTARLTLASVGFDKDLSNRFQVGSDVSYSDYSSTQTSGNVEGTPSRQDYYYTLRFRLDEAFGAQTYAAWYLRYADGTDSRTSSFFWNNRFTFWQRWDFYPRFRVDYTDFTDTNQSQWFFEPSLRLDFRPKQNLYFELETGYDRTQRDTPLQSFDVVGYYVRIGYRSLF